ncbi:hypothetical protein [Ensifer sp. Root278]|uniref:hypothetical protein n=1 Tax=unclassified Ensifer TaxID=2633371 RepID=UPI0007095EEB|nr:hypothetical protein [Ensifer sp. Root278]KRD56489.1 hypothetical protein ASE60_08490 [Ensifer sp. Root278]
MSKITIQNTRPGGFGIPGGPVIAGGGSLEVETSDWKTIKGHPVVKAWVDAGHLTLDGDEEGADEGDGSKSVTEVLAMATDPNVQFMSFKAAAAKLLGDKTPAKKDEIIAALEDLATKP